MVTANDLVAQAKAKIKEINTEELSQSLRQPVVLIDVREPAEYAQGYIADAVNIPRGLLEFQIENHPAIASHKAKQANLRDTKIVLYCKSGGRSALAAESLMKMGFNDVLSLEGGFSAWESAGKAVTK